MGNCQPEGRRLDSQAGSGVQFTIFCFVWVLTGLDDAHLHKKERSASLSLLIHVLISSRNTLVGIPINVWPNT